ncbi:MAG: N-acetyltransferase [Dehalococcoidia bacterium]
MPGRITSKIAYYRRLSADGDREALLGDLRRWWWSDEDAFGLSRDLTMPHTPPAARIAISIHPLTRELADRVLDPTGLDPADRREVAHRRRLFESSLGTGYVALTEDGSPCYVQWAIPGAQAAGVDDFFRGIFPHLRPDELLLEGAWAHPNARGQRVMAEAMSRITEAGARPEHRRAITFVAVDNEASLRGCHSAGFSNYIARHEHWRFGRRAVAWGALDPGLDIAS